MNATTPTRRSPFSVGQRLVLGLLPSLLALALVVGLRYWGEYGRSAPEVVVTSAALLAVVSLVATWFNARDLTRRIARLSGTVATVRRMVGGTDEAGRDELDMVEQVIERLRASLATAEEARLAAERVAADEARRQAALTEATARETLVRLDEMRLPIHILLESRFGELNDNQEELLAAARDAGDALDTSLRLLQRVAAATHGTLPVQRALVPLNDVVRAAEPQVRAFAERAGRSVIVELEPGLPRAWVDRAKLAEALVLLARLALSAPGSEVLHIRTGGVSPSPGAGGRQAMVSLAPFDDVHVVGGDVAERRADRDVLDEALAMRLLSTQGARIEREGRELRIVVTVG